MGAEHYNTLEVVIVTLNGSWQQLDFDGSIAKGKFTKVGTLSLQPAASNTHAVSVSSAAGAVADTPGVVLPAPVTSIAPPPFLMGEGTKNQFVLQQFWVKGTDAETLRVMFYVYP